ncbi:MAG: DUF1330 domain-containing protein [Gemmatimonadales bacterium]
MSDPFVLVVGLWTAPGRDDDFERFETAAFSIVARHGGSLARRLALRDGPGSDAPDEMHIVTFPSRDAYESYRNDPDVASLAALRVRAVLRTVIWEGVDLPPFGA